MQFVPKTELRDSAIWQYMLEGRYGKKQQQYAEKVESAYKSRPRRTTIPKLSLDQLIAELV